MSKEVSANNKKLTFINDRIDPELITSISISTEKVNLYNYKGINVNKSKYDNKDLFAVDTNNFLLSEKDTSIEIYPTNKNVLIKNTNKIKKENIESYESILDKRLNLGSYLNDNDYSNFFQKAELPLLFNNNNNNENFTTMNDFYSYKDPYTDENTYIEEGNNNYSLVSFNKERNELADMVITVNSDNAEFNWLTMNYSLSNNCLGDFITFTNDSSLKPAKANKEVKAEADKDKEDLSSEKKEDDEKFTFTLDKNMWYSNGELMSSNYYLNNSSTLLPTISLSSIHINMSDWWGIDQFDKYKINNYQSSWYSSPYSCSCSSCTCDGSNKYFDINIDTDKSIEVNQSYTQLLENDLFKNDSLENISFKNNFVENDSSEDNLLKDDSLKSDSLKNNSLKNDFSKNDSSKNDLWKDNLLKEFPFKNDLINLFKNNLVKYDSLEKFSLKNDLIKDASLKNDYIKDNLLKNDLIKDNSLKNDLIKENSLKNDYIKENYTIDSPLTQKDNNSYKKPFNQEIREEINKVLRKYKINKKQLIEIIQ